MLDRIQSDVFRHFRGFAVISALLDWQLANVGTACTNGRWIKYDPTFLETLTRRERLGLALHEILHIVRKHHLITEIDGVAIVHDLANQAYDYWINRELLANSAFRASCDLPKGALFNRRFDGLDERQIYRILLSESDNQDENEPENQDSDETGTPDDQEGDDQTDVEPSQDEIDGYGIGGVIPDDQPEDGETQEDQNPLSDAKKIDQLLQQAAIASQLAGSGGGLLESIAGKASKPSVNWKSALKKHISRKIKTNRNWKSLDRIFKRQGYKIPGKQQSLPRIGIYIDASYSQSIEQINADIAEVNQLMTDFKPVIELNSFTETVMELGEHRTRLPKLESVERGGTNFNAVVGHFDNSDCELAIVLTDGYCHISTDTVKPILWIWTHSDSFGETSNTIKIKKHI